MSRYWQPVRYVQVLSMHFFSFCFRRLQQSRGLRRVVSSQSRLDAFGDLPFPHRAPSSISDRLTVVDVLGLGPRQRVSIVLL